MLTFTYSSYNIILEARIFLEEVVMIESGDVDYGLSPVLSKKDTNGSYNRSVESYLADIGKIPLLSDMEEKEFSKKLDKARKELFGTLLSLKFSGRVDKARKFKKNGEEKLLEKYCTPRSEQEMLLCDLRDEFNLRLLIEKRKGAISFKFLSSKFPLLCGEAIEIALRERRSKGGDWKYWKARIVEKLRQIPNLKPELKKPLEKLNHIICQFMRNVSIA